jgi:hypothetical protein
LIPCFPIYKAKRDELRGARVCRLFQSIWRIQSVITAQRSLKSLRRDTLRELLTHLILSMPVWLLVIWDLEAEDEEASFSEWKTNFVRYHWELEWTHIRGHQESFP